MMLAAAGRRYIFSGSSKISRIVNNQYLANGINGHPIATSINCYHQTTNFNGHHLPTGVNNHFLSTNVYGYNILTNNNDYRLAICTTRRTFSMTLRNHVIPINHREYSSAQQPEETPEKKRSETPKKSPAYKFALYVVATLLSLHIISLIFKKRFKNRRERSSRNEVIYHRDRFCSGNSGVLLNISNFWLPSEFFNESNKIQQIQKFPVSDNDVLVASFPKSGTTWVQEIVHQILVGSDESDQATMEERFPYLEYVYPGLRELSKSAHPCHIKTHLPYELLPEDVHQGHGKVIYVARNAKDVSVSYFHFLKMLTATKYSGEFNNFLNSFQEGKVAYGPWPDHVLQYWDNRDQDNILFITYEDLQENPVSMVKRIGAFLGRTLDNKQATAIAHHCSFSEMEQNSLVNYSWWDELGIRDKRQSRFMRKGRVRDWENYYTADMVEQIEASCVEPTRKKGLNMKDKI